MRMAGYNTNRCCGAGRQKLSPTERAKFGTVPQAKAHLQKAEKTGNVKMGKDQNFMPKLAAALYSGAASADAAWRRLPVRLREKRSPRVWVKPTV